MYICVSLLMDPGVLIFQTFSFFHKTPLSFLTLHYPNMYGSRELLHQTMVKLTLITTVIYRLHPLTNFSSFLQTEDSRTLREQTGLLPPTAMVNFELLILRVSTLCGNLLLLFLYPFRIFNTLHTFIFPQQCSLVALTFWFCLSHY